MLKLRYISVVKSTIYKIYIFYLFNPSITLYPPKIQKKYTSQRNKIWMFYLAHIICKI